MKIYRKNCALKKEKNTENKLLSDREKIKQVKKTAVDSKRCPLYLNHIACWKAV
jgi:hypothetical protein